MAAEDTPNTPLSSGTDSSAEDRMTILQRRLAEIQAKPDANAAPALLDPAEIPAHGSPALPTAEPARAGTAEATQDEVSPEAAAAAETALHVPDEVTVDGHDVSAPQARAIAHDGEEMAPSPTEQSFDDQPITSAAPAPIADPETLTEVPAATVEEQAPELSPGG